VLIFLGTNILISISKQLTTTEEDAIAHATAIAQHVHWKITNDQHLVPNIYNNKIIPIYEEGATDGNKYSASQAYDEIKKDGRFKGYLVRATITSSRVKSVFASIHNERKKGKITAAATTPFVEIRSITN
jgi:hypothetical protein